MSSLIANNKSKLLELLSSFSKLFSGNLGRYVNKFFLITLKDPKATPIFCNPYQIPLIHQAVFRKELEHLIEAQVLQRVERSEWAFPTFLIPKKDGRVCWISDFRRLNKLLTCPRYFLPNIPSIMQKRSGFTHITKIDISMGFYTFELDDQAQHFFVISTPFGPFKYLHLSIGLTNSPDVFQSVMHPLFQDIPEVECFIDDKGVFTNTTFDQHLIVLHQVLLRLEGNGFTVNPTK